MSEPIICNFCSKNFKNKYTLKIHQNTSKKCLKAQNKDEIEVLNFKCEYCKKIFSSKYNLENHVNSCRESDKLKILEFIKKIECQEKKIDKLRNENKELEKFKIYKELYEDQKHKYLKLEDQHKLLNEKYQKSLEELANKAIENAGPKTINNTTNRNRIIQSLQPLTNDFMREQTKFLTYSNVKDGAHGIAHFASNHTFKDRVYCSDVSRLSFVFKNEADNIIKDPEGVEITKRFIEINRDELLRLLDEYLKYVNNELETDLDRFEYEHWAQRREETIAIRSAVRKGNIPENKDSYNEFKRNFLTALSELVAR